MHGVGGPLLRLLMNYFADGNKDDGADQASEERRKLVLKNQLSIENVGQAEEKWLREPPLRNKNGSESHRCGRKMAPRAAIAEER